MFKRIYLLSPDVDHALSVVSELEASGVGREHIHTLARGDIDIGLLPPATREQERSNLWFFDRLFWVSDMILYMLAFVFFTLALYFEFYTWALVAFILMSIAWAIGEIYTIREPHVHLTGVKEAIASGEILLMVDIPKQRVREIDTMISKHHPEIDHGVIGWNFRALVI